MNEKRHDRIGGRPIIAFGLTLDAIAFSWMAYVAGPDTSYAQLLPALVLPGIGTASLFASVANVVMGAVRPEEAGQASGATARPSRSSPHRSPRRRTLSGNTERRPSGAALCRPG